MASVNARSTSATTFKRAEREVGQKIESVARSSCAAWKSVELESSLDGKIKGSYDYGWQKNKRSHNSKTGQGTVVGYETKKCIGYATRNTSCRRCEEASKKGVFALPHECRRNHDGSSKSMEASAAVELFSQGGYSVLIGDDDSSVISRVRAEVDDKIEKWSDINHAVCTFKRGLYEVRGKSFGTSQCDKITDGAIEHLSKCFTYCLMQHKNDPSGLKAGLEVIVPQTFGDHSKCRNTTWCKHKENPTSYQHSSLPGGRPLMGQQLQTFLTEHMKAFSSDQAVRKLAPLGSSQCNECLNGVVSTKNPKSRYYGGSESSDFRIAAAVAQFNEGHDYLQQVRQQFTPNQPRSNLQTYATRMNRKRKQQYERKSQPKVKVRRRCLKAKKGAKLKRKEQKEGTTYQSGIGFTAIVSDEDVARYTENSSGYHQVQKYLEDNRLLQNITEAQHTKQALDKEKGDTATLTFDLETTGFSKDAEILQLSCVKLDGQGQFSTYIIPKGSICTSATKHT
ncbi:hypothetical protein QZH41_000859 [Actinostola sp. cb2023]|nr:hypothetical protein QZH41_000859 [Actinostola sp. cb2023]